MWGEPFEKGSPHAPRENFQTKELMFVRCEFGRERQVVRPPLTSICRSRPPDGDRFGKERCGGGLLKKAPPTPPAKTFKQRN